MLKMLLDSLGVTPEQLEGYAADAKTFLATFNDMATRLTRMEARQLELEADAAARRATDKVSGNDPAGVSMGCANPECWRCQVARDRAHLDALADAPRLPFDHFKDDTQAEDMRDGH